MKRNTGRASPPPTTRPPVKRTRSAAVGAAAPTPTEEQIARRAYEIYLSRNGGEGDSLHDWLAAERELLAEATPLRIRARRQPPDPAPES